MRISNFFLFQGAETKHRINFIQFRDKCTKIITKNVKKKPPPTYPRPRGATPNESPYQIHSSELEIRKLKHGSVDSTDSGYDAATDVKIICHNVDKEMQSDHYDNSQLTPSHRNPVSRAVTCSSCDVTVSPRDTIVVPRSHAECECSDGESLNISGNFQLFTPPTKCSDKDYTKSLRSKLRERLVVDDGDILPDAELESLLSIFTSNSAAFQDKLQHLPIERLVDSFLVAIGSISNVDITEYVNVTADDEASSDDETSSAGLADSDTVWSEGEIEVLCLSSDSE